MKRLLIALILTLSATAQAAPPAPEKVKWTHEYGDLVGIYGRCRILFRGPDTTRADVEKLAYNFLKNGNICSRQRLHNRWTIIGLDRTILSKPYEGFMIETLAVSSAADVERIENEAKDEAHRMAQAFGCNYRVVYSIDDYSGYTTETVATIVGYPDGRGSTVEWKVPH